MNNLKETRTGANLIAAFENESATCGHYDFYASAAKKEGYGQLSASFAEISQNGMGYARLWLELLYSDNIPDAITNLKDCIKKERHKHLEMYSIMAEEAREDGFEEIANLFRDAAVMNRVHETICRELIQMLKRKKNKTLK